MSAESGISTFRDSNGLWENHAIEDVATYEAFKRDRELVLDFYNARRKQLFEVEPNKGHELIAKLEEEYQVSVVTQNVDDLHERAGSKNLIHMHGELLKMRCIQCHQVRSVSGALTVESVCGDCQRTGTLRPDIVWFGEMPYGMDGIEMALSEADIFAAIGTSGNVYPAAGFVQMAKSCGAHTIELNLEPSATASQFAETRFGTASETVPIRVDHILKG